jgi:hypothetical protein
MIAELGSLQPTVEEGSATYNVIEKGDDGHFRFRSLCWQPVPIDSEVRLEVEAAG